MITKETASAMARVYRDIEAAEKLLAEVDEGIARSKEQIDFHGEPRSTARPCQLGWPDGNGYRLYNVEPEIARVVIVAHLADQEAKLKKINAAAILEANPPDTGRPY